MSATPTRLLGRTLGLLLTFTPALALAQEVPETTELPSGSAPPGAPPGATLPDATSAEPIDITVRARPGERKRHEQSAEAVTVVRLQRAQRQAGDLGSVLARVAGVTVQRAGGLGSEMRLALNGLTQDQVRFFIDDLPLDLTFFPFGIASFPLHLAQSVELYKGVVPLRFGADALGGAVNLVLPNRHENHARASYEVGSFGLHRGTLSAGYRHAPSGFVLHALAYADRADNDYPIDVQAIDQRGRPVAARVRRFHDRYVAYGASIEAGVVERRWAERLLLRGYVGSYDKALQSNPVMKVPYGEVEYGEQAAGASVRYDVGLSPAVHLSLVGAYGRRRIDFEDTSRWVYDWYGRRIQMRRTPGEIDGRPYDQSSYQDAGLGRAVLTWTIAPAHVLTLTSSPTFTTRGGNDRTHLPGQRDPLRAQRDLLVVVSGVEYEANLFALARAPEEPAERDKDFDYRLQNILFLKSYLYRSKSEEVLGDVVRAHDVGTHTFGFGDSLRLRIRRELLAKVSYEYATRMPRPDEVFGNGVLVAMNLDLRPEVSHNLNLGPRLELRWRQRASLVTELSGFLRSVDRQIVLLLVSDARQRYQNVLHARTLGVEWTAYYTAPRRIAELDASITYLDQRNVSRGGTFGAYRGDRIPNRPWLMGSWGARLRFPSVLFTRDAIEPFYLGRYVHDFLRGWESFGDPTQKQRIRTQVTHGLGVSWLVTLARGAELTCTFEAQNITDEKVYDFFGVQRPGRAYYLKLTAGL